MAKGGKGEKRENRKNKKRRTDHGRSRHLAIGKEGDLRDLDEKRQIVAKENSPNLVLVLPDLVVLAILLSAFRPICNCIRRRQGRRNARQARQALGNLLLVGRHRWRIVARQREIHCSRHFKGNK